MEPLLSDKDVLTRIDMGQVSKIPVGGSTTSRSLRRCTKYKTGVKFFLKTSLMQVNQRCAASSSEEKLHAQLPHLKVDRGHYEVRIIEDLPL